MIRSTRCLCGTILSAISLLTPMAPFAQEKAQTKQDSAAATPPNSANPGPEHAALLKRAGDYTRIVKFLGQPGEPFSGTAKLSTVLGGRFLLEESSDVVFGRTVEGLRLYGYNNATRQYEMARMYTMSTAITMMTGTSKDGGQTIDFTTTPDPAGPGKTPLHAQLRSINEDEFVVTFSTVKPDGQQTPFQETSYKRKK